MKTTKVKSHLRKGKMVKAHTRKNKWDKDMDSYYSSTSLKKKPVKTNSYKDKVSSMKKNGTLKFTSNYALQKHILGEDKYWVQHSRTYETSPTITKEQALKLKK